MTPILYGIPNCDTVKKARDWLNQQGIVYTFHDFKKSGVTHELVQDWLRHVDWETLINRKGTTWRGLPEERKASITGPISAGELMIELPSVIKRPVLARKNHVHVGFSDTLYQQIFNQQP